MSGIYTNSYQLQRIIDLLTGQGAQIMGLKDDLDAVLVQLGKAKTEILAKLDDLESKVAAGQDVAQEVADLKAMAQSLDDVVPDA